MDPTSAKSQTSQTEQDSSNNGSSGDSSQPWNDETKRKFQIKSKSEFYDPCQELAQRSYKCLHRNGGDKSMCGEYFQAYRDCKQAWTEKRRQEKGSFW